MDAERLIELLENAGYDPASYSGRCMYGARCVSVTVPTGDMLSVGVKLAGEALNDMSEHDGDVLDVVEVVDRLMANVRWDNMGRDDMVIYWPDVAWPTSTT